jgi:hypothetical protein
VTLVSWPDQFDVGQPPRQVQVRQPQLLASAGQDEPDRFGGPAMELQPMAALVFDALQQCGVVALAWLHLAKVVVGLAEVMQNIAAVARAAQVLLLGVAEGTVARLDQREAGLTALGVDEPEVAVAPLQA